MYKYKIKRIIDIFLSIIIFFVILIPLIVILIGVKFETKKTVFFRQKRLGENNRPFIILKIRTIYDKKSSYGNFLRKYSIDELPQIFNIIKGEMSLVGPRPEQPHLANFYKKNIENYEMRKSVLPGITGLAQVKGFRGNTSITERIKLDIIYIDKMSFIFDIKIIFLTIFGGFIDKNV